MIYIYMNEHIKEKSPTDPVIVVTDKKKMNVAANSVRIIDENYSVLATIKFSKGGLKGVNHHVKAWIEVADLANLEVIYE